MSSTLANASNIDFVSRSIHHTFYHHLLLLCAHVVRLLHYNVCNSPLTTACLHTPVTQALTRVFTPLNVCMAVRLQQRRMCPRNTYATRRTDWWRRAKKRHAKSTRRRQNVLAGVWLLKKKYFISRSLANRQKREKHLITKWLSLEHGNNSRIIAPTQPIQQLENAEERIANRIDICTCLVVLHCFDIPCGCVEWQYNVRNANA